MQIFRVYILSIHYTAVHTERIIVHNESVTFIFQIKVDVSDTYKHI